MKKKLKNISILDNGFMVEGKIAAKGQLIIKGLVRGTLVAESVVIAEEGTVTADAKVGRMTVGGKFEGSIRASDELIVLRTGSCSGKIVCRDFIVEPGGVLNAEVNCTAHHAGEVAAVTASREEKTKT